MFRIKVIIKSHHVTWMGTSQLFFSLVLFCFYGGKFICACSSRVLRVYYSMETWHQMAGTYSSSNKKLRDPIFEHYGRTRKLKRSHLQLQESLKLRQLCHPPLGKILPKIHSWSFWSHPGCIAHSASQTLCLML